MQRELKRVAHCPRCDFNVCEACLNRRPAHIVLEELFEKFKQAAKEVTKCCDTDLLKEEVQSTDNHGTLQFFCA